MILLFLVDSLSDYVIKMSKRDSLGDWLAEKYNTEDEDYAYALQLSLDASNNDNNNESKARSGELT